MTTITIDRATVEQALEALESVLCDPEGKCCIDGSDADRAVVDKALAAFRAALAQQAEPVAAERERCAEYLMQQAAECREDSPTRVTLESCAAVLRLGLHAQAEPVEPVAYRHLHEDGWEYHDAPTGEDCAECQALYTAPPQRKPLTDEEIDAVWDQWFGAYGLRGPRGPYTRRGFARAVERALEEKNRGR